MYGIRKLTTEKPTFEPLSLSAELALKANTSTASCT